jgi:hypothetical protein
VRTLSSFSRAFGAAAVIAAAVLILGGAFLVGYVGELQRTLNDPTAARTAAGRHIAAVEQALGHGGFIKTYRNYRLTGDAASRLQLTQHAIQADRAIGELKKLYRDNPRAADALKEAESVGQTFVHVAQTEPETALRGTAAAIDLTTLPQLEASYLALRGALDRLTAAELDEQLGGAASVLNWSQIAIIAAVGALVVALLTVAGLLQLGIIQPLKTLERSLTAVGDGVVAQKVWGTDRNDEFGALARAGDKLRRSLTETSALKALAEKGQVHITLDGQSSLLFQRLADEVTNTTNALKSAAADFAKLQDGNRRQWETALAGLSASTSGADQAAEALRRSATSSLEHMRTANTGMAAAATDRLKRLDRLTAKYEQSHDEIVDMATDVRDRTTLAVEELSASTTTLRNAAEAVGKIKTTLAQSFEDVSADAGKATDKVRTLAARLSETIGLVDERLSRKLAALGTLEQAVAANLASLRTRAEETSAAVNAAAGDMTRQPSGETNELKAAIARLDQIAERIADPARDRAALGSNLDELANALNTQLETVRGEIRDLAIRMTEERLLTNAGTSPAFTLAVDGPALTQTPQRTLADVPGNEILARLKDLAAEMNAAQEETDHTASLKAALGKFAAEVKDLVSGADRTARLKAMGRALDQHAEEIETHMPAVGPSTALRSELGAITSELRAIAARAQANGTKDGAELRESAVEIGARAESLFTYLNETHPDEQPDDEVEHLPDATADIAALAHLIDRMEARANSLSALDPNLTTNGAIHMVFESIGRLNNIATALSRAGHGERQRHATH